MSKKKRNATKILNKSEYLNLFPKDKGLGSENMRFLALKEAQDIRKFEINLYWKRTGFFWAFITVIYAALFAVICKYLECFETYSFFVPVISTLSGLGFFFSTAWHMVNKGSKFWQMNWETHVSLLEESEIGPLYDVYLNPRKTGSRLCPTKEFDFSVTKVNMWASTVISLISLFACIFCSIWLFKFSEHNFFSFIPSSIIGIITILVFIFNQGNKNIKISESEESDINMIHKK